jgi:hypothetical protein
VSDPVSQAVGLFNRARRYVEDSPFAREIQWQATRDFATFSETDLLREDAWVILCSGFKESVVRRHFSFISLCFCDWESADEICAEPDRCRVTALTRFNSVRKIDAILRTAAYIKGIGFGALKTQVLERPLVAFQSLPFIGPVTAHHLAKNLGIATAKPDRHLVRLATSMGFCDVQELCKTIGDVVGEPIHVIDLILWRYAEQNFLDA